VTEDLVHTPTGAPGALPHGDVPINIVTRDVDGDAVAYAEKRIAAAIDMIVEPILHIRVKLARSGDPGRQRPASAKVTLDINGEAIRAQVAADTITEAIDLVAERLRRQLEDRAERRTTRRELGRMAAPGAWRRGDLPTERPPYFERPPEERQIVRFKSYPIEEVTPDEAAFDMDLLDHDFHLFRELASGDDALLERLPGGRYRMTRLAPSDAGAGPTAVELEIGEEVPPTLTADEAVERMAESGERQVFFRDRASGRGSVLYRRYDGHYGLITPE
jgi:ribosome-associated translation inhibitor RaiA